MTTSALAPEAERELERFLLLCSEIGPGLSMFSAHVDAVWHDKLKDQATYATYCKDLGLQPVGHLSEEDASRPGSTAWVNLYEARWGLLDASWFADEAGNVDANALERYRQSRSISTDAGCCQDTEWQPAAGCCQDTE